MFLFTSVPTEAPVVPSVNSISTLRQLGIQKKVEIMIFGQDHLLPKQWFENTEIFQKQLFSENNSVRARFKL